MEKKVFNLSGNPDLRRCINHVAFKFLGVTSYIFKTVIRCTFHFDKSVNIVLQKFY